MADSTSSQPEAPWPFYNDQGKVTPQASTAIGGEPDMLVSWRGGWQGGWRGRMRGPLRVRASALDVAARETGRSIVTLGWHPDIPDVRDRSLANQKVVALPNTTAKTNEGADASVQALKPRHENLKWCSPVEDQGSLGSCTAQAVVSLLEFMQGRAGQSHTDGSRLFVYKVTRKLLGWTGDTGAYIRTAMKAVVAFGVPPEEYWPYDISRYEEEPSAFLYSFAQNYQALEYTRIDSPGHLPTDVLCDVKRVLATGLGVVFGFSVYSSISNAPDIPFPTERDNLLGGHAVMAVGYDDNHVLPDGSSCPSLIIRNSWGVNWGIGGYGFLPYKYVTQSLTRDFWTVLKSEWINMDSATDGQVRG